VLVRAVARFLLSKLRSPFSPRRHPNTNRSLCSFSRSSPAASPRPVNQPASGPIQSPKVPSRPLTEMSGRCGPHRGSSPPGHAPSRVRASTLTDHPADLRQLSGRPALLHRCLSRLVRAEAFPSARFRPCCPLRCSSADQTNLRDCSSAEAVDFRALLHRRVRSTDLCFQLPIPYPFMGFGPLRGPSSPPPFRQTLHRNAPSCRSSHPFRGSTRSSKPEFVAAEVYPVVLFAGPFRSTHAARRPPTSRGVSRRPPWGF
jgi:hypothetical protein